MSATQVGRAGASELWTGRQSEPPTPNISGGRGQAARERLPPPAAPAEGGASPVRLPVGPSGAGHPPVSRSAAPAQPVIQSSGCRRQDGAAAAAGRRLLLMARAGLVGVFAANRTGAARGAVPLPALHRRPPRLLPSRRTRDHRLPGASARARLWLLSSLCPLRGGALRGVHATLRLRVPLLPESRR